MEGFGSLATNPRLQLPSTEAELELGCATATTYSHLDKCPPTSLAGKFGCTWVSETKPSTTLAGLLPEYFCISDAKPPDGRYIRSESGNFLTVYYRFLALEHGRYTLITDLKALAERFLPFDSEEKALEFVVAATGLSVDHDAKYDYRHEFFVTDLERGNAKRVGDGFRVLLYQYKSIGCSPHPMYAVTLKLDLDGTIHHESKTKVFEVHNGVCAD